MLLFGYLNTMPYALQVNTEHMPVESNQINLSLAGDLVRKLISNSKPVPSSLFVLILLLATNCSAQPQALGLSLLDALSTTLDRNPAIRLQLAVVDSQRAVLRQTAGQFDTQLSAGSNASRAYSPSTVGVRADSIESNVVSLTGSAQRQLLNGITVGPQVTVAREQNNTLNTNSITSTRVVYSVNIPLLRGHGREVVGAPRQSAAQNVDAALLSLNDTTAHLLEATAEAYWNVRGALENLTIAQDSERQGVRFVETVQTLIAADKKARNDIYAPQANLASRTAARIAAETQLYQARQQLAFAMGFSPADMAELPDPTDKFPVPDAALTRVSYQSRSQGLLSMALRRRADLLAEQKRQQANQTLLISARNALKPQLDLTLNGGYSGLTDGRGLPDGRGAAYPGAHGPDLTGALSYKFAPRNNAAEGRLTVQELTVRQSDLRQQDLGRTIALEIRKNLEGARLGADQIKSAEASVEAYTNALQGEEDKLSLGLGSLIDILTVEDRLRAARLTSVGARLSYSVSLARLRLAAGAIVAPDEAIQSVGKEIFLELPAEATVLDNK